MHENKIEDGESSTIVQTTIQRQRFSLCRNKFLFEDVRGILNATHLEGYGLRLHGDDLSYVLHGIYIL